MPKTKVVFLGTSAIAKICLEKVLNLDMLEVVGVITQPDRPRGRKMKLTPCDAKAFALEQGLPVLSPESINTKESLAKVKKLNAQAAIVVAFGQILSDEFLNLYPLKVVNVHTSLLPHLRGAAPIQRAIMNGDDKTGVCLQVMVKKLDAGDVIAKKEVTITDDMDAIDLHDRLAKLAGKLLTTDFIKYLNGKITPEAQDESLVTYAKKIEKSEAVIDWSLPAQTIFNRIRGLKLGPGSVTIFDDKRLKIHKVGPVEGQNFEGTKPGAVIQVGSESFTVQAKSGSALEIFEVQPESKQKMISSDFIRGYGIQQGDVLGE